MARRTFAVFAGLVLALTMAATAFADYGNTAVYQVEISANGVGASQGGGVWLWIELSADQSGTYAGADCGREGPGAAGAASDSGPVTWTSGSGWLTISGVRLNGLGGLPVTIHVKSTDGHYVTTISSVFGIGFPGWAQVTIAP
jgi:hypothetical protein